MSRKFKWDAWNFDGSGEAYIIAKNECPNREDVPGWIIKTDHLSTSCLNPEIGEHLSVEDVKDGWCKYQVRSDWDYDDWDYADPPRGGYYVEAYCCKQGQPGWFPVWIVRKGEWY